MSVRVKHPFVETLIPDDAGDLAAGKICGDAHWNALHSLTQDVGGLVGSPDDDGDIRELAVDEVKVFVLAALGLTGWDAIGDSILLTRTDGKEILIGPFE